MQADLAAAAPVEAVPQLRGRSVLRLRGTRLSGVVLVCSLLVVWELSARLGWVNSANWPPISSVVVALSTGLAGGDLVEPLASTLTRTLAGYAIGCAAGMAVGLLLGSNRWLGYLLRPLLELIRPIPVPAIVPPLILLLGVDDALKVFIVALSCFFPVFVNAFDGVRGLDETLLQTARTFRIVERQAEGVHGRRRR